MNDSEQRWRKNGFEAGLAHACFVAIQNDCPRPTAEALVACLRNYIDAQAVFGNRRDDMTRVKMPRHIWAMFDALGAAKKFAPFSGMFGQASVKSSQPMTNGSSSQGKRKDGNPGQDALKGEHHEKQTHPRTVS
jgi:hypothetical protein